MENKTKDSQFVSPSNQIAPDLPKWLGENFEGLNGSIKQMLEIIEHAEDSSPERAEMYYQRRHKLISLIDQINQKHQTLAEQYDILIENLRANSPATHQMQNPESTIWHTCKHSCLLTPDHKLGMHKFERRAIPFDFPLSSGGSSSHVSVKESFESTSVLSSDSDTESYLSSPHRYSRKCYSGQLERENFVETRSKVKEVREYDMLLSRTAEYEEKLRSSNQTLGFAEEEISQLKSELKNKALVNPDSLKTKLEMAKDEVKLREADLYEERYKVSELDKKVAHLENELFDFSCEIATLVKELEVSREKLRTSEEEVTRLNHDLSNEISQSTMQLCNQLESTQNELASEKMQNVELLERITSYKAAIADQDYEIRKLNMALQDSLRGYETEKSKLQSQNTSLLENLSPLKVKCAEYEVQVKSLEKDIRQSEDREMTLFGDIEGLKGKLHEKDKAVEYLNEILDGLKSKYDMLMVEKDGLNGKVQTLDAELCSRDDKIQNMGDQLGQLQLQQIELKEVCKSSFKPIDELRWKVKVLEKEVEKQALMLSDRAEEKREAIRQLCFSLEHYRTEYKELRVAYIGQRKHASVAS